ncbi:hypothetical protein [Mycoplasma sp. CSL7503-lung]|uniref:hypothetical protein n=1 Tax=Mycoplasma sp. CSL7503-lung TaxID=536372 RepID=UPI0021CF8C3C|nr:hypothetical protein [Mycoplasma sp. CSL7503-lung]MCU4706854.1 hypothetical protein [Mycoplasma sp. CSL7503-lung]
MSFVSNFIHLTYKINEQGSYKNNTVIVDQYDKKEQLQAEAENANNYSELHNIENTAEVEKYAKYVKDEINKVLDKGNMLEQVEEILKNRPSTDDEKQNKINALEQIAQKAREKARSELAELNLAKENAKREIKEKVNLSSEKQQEFIGRINQSNTKEEVKNVINDVNKFISDEKTKVENNFINKLTENKDPKNKLKTSLDNATSEIEIANIKNEAIAELNKFKNNAEIAVQRLSEDIQGQNNHLDFVTKLNDAKTTGTQKAYEDVVNEVEKQIEKLKTWAKSNLEQINDQEEKNKIKELIESADTSLKLKELENRVNLTIAREKAENAIKKLSDTNEQKNQLLNFIYSSNSLQDIATKQAEAEKIINDKKEEAKDAVAKLEGDLTYVKANEDLAKADTEDQLNNLIRLSNETFNNKKDDISSEINKLILDKDLMSTNGLNTIKKLKDYYTNTIIHKALEYTNSKIAEVADETKKQELEQMLKNKSQVDDINEVYNLAVAELDRENALENAKTQAKELAMNKLSDEDLESFNTKISQANTIEEVNAIKREIQAKVDDKNRELTKLKNKFLDSNEVKKNVENASKNSVKEIEKLIENLQNEKTKIISKTSSDLEKIHVTESRLLTDDKMNEENSKYDDLKLEFDSINDSNWTEEKDKLISSKVDQAILLRKNKARDHINSLGLDKSKKDQLINELNSDDTNTYTKIIKLEKKADRELRVKNIKDKISKINDENVRNDLNNRANSENQDLEVLEIDVDRKLKEQEDSINLSKEEAREEVKKLPLSEQKTENDNIDSATTQDQIDTIKQRVIQRMETLRTEVQDEIDKMPLNARNYLNDKKVSALDNGDELLLLKKLAIETVSESEKLKTKNATDFSSEQKAKEFFESKINSSIAESKEKIKSLSNDFEIIKNKLKTLRTKQAELGNEYKNQFDLMVSDVFKDLNKEIIGNNSVNSMLDSIIEKINFRKKQNDAIKDIKDKFEDENQTTTIVENINNLTSNDDGGLETLITNANNLFNNLQSLKNTINSIGKESNRTLLLEEWKKVDALDKMETLNIRANSFKTTLESVQQELNNLSNRSDNKRDLQLELNNSTTKDQIDIVKDKIQREKLKVNWIEIRDRLSEGENKTNWNSIITNSDSTFAQMTDTIKEAKKFLSDKRDKAIKELSRLNDDNNIKTNSISKTTTYNTEAEYDNIINGVLTDLKTKAIDANGYLNKLKLETKEKNELRTSYMFKENGEIEDDITESIINIDIKKVKDILQDKYDDVVSKLVILNGDSTVQDDFMKMMGERSRAYDKKESMYDAILDKANTFFNDKVDKVDKMILQIKRNTTKAKYFKEKLKIADNLGKINLLIKEIDKYYELDSFTPSINNINRFNWVNEDVVGKIQFNKLEGSYKNKYIYLVVRSDNGEDIVLSEGILFNKEELEFRFLIRNFRTSGIYNLDRIIIMENNTSDNNTILSSKNEISKERGDLNNFQVKFGTVTANRVSMEWNNLSSRLSHKRNATGVEIIEKAVDSSVRISGFTISNINPQHIHNISIKLKGEAKISENYFANSSYNNLTLIHKLDFNSKDDIRIINNGNNIQFEFIAKGMRAGYIYNIDKIEFEVTNGLNNSNFVFNKNKDVNEKNSVEYSDSYSYINNNKESLSWLFKLSKKDRDTLLQFDDTKNNGHYYPIKDDEKYVSVFAFKDGWNSNTFGSLFKYLNSFVPNTQSEYDAETSSTKHSLRSKWVDFFVDRLANKYIEIYNENNQRASIPTNRYYYEWNSPSVIQLGVTDDKKQYEGIINRGKSIFNPVLGGRNMFYDFKFSPKYQEKMMKFMKKAINNDDSDENHMSVWVLWIEGTSKKIWPNWNLDNEDIRVLRKNISLAFDFILEFGATNYVGSDQIEYPEYIKNR